MVPSLLPQANIIAVLTVSRMSMIDFYNALVGYFNLIQQHIILPSAILIKQSRDLIFRRTN